MAGRERAEQPEHADGAPTDRVQLLNALSATVAVDATVVSEERSLLRASLAWQMPVLPVRSATDHLLVTSCSSAALRRAAEGFGRALQREVGYDTPLCLASDFGDQHVWLLRHRIASCSFVAAGAIGLWQVPAGQPGSDNWVLEWMTVHPYARGRGLVRRAWPRLGELYGNFAVGPVRSPATVALLSRLGYAEPGWRQQPAS